MTGGQAVTRGDGGRRLSTEFLVNHEIAKPFECPTNVTELEDEGSVSESVLRERWVWNFGHPVSQGQPPAAQIRETIDHSFDS